MGGLNLSFSKGQSIALFPLRNGKSGGQTLYGGTEASEGLQLHSTLHATKGKITLGGFLTIDEVNGRIGMNETAPAAPAVFKVATNALSRILTLQNTDTGSGSASEYAVTNDASFGVTVTTFGSAYAAALFDGTPLTGMSRVRTGSAQPALVLSSGGNNRYVAIGGGNGFEQMRIAAGGISVGSRAAQNGATVTAKARLDVAGSNALATGFAQIWRNLGAELITATNDRTFAGAGNWTGTNWAVSAGVFLHTTGSTAAATLTSANLTAAQIKTDNLYRVSFTVAGRTAGTLTPALGATAGLTISINGAMIQDIFAAADDASLTFTPSTDFDGSIDNISILRLAPVASVNNLGLGLFNGGIRLDGDPGSGVASTITVTDDVAGTPGDTSTPTKWLKVYDGTTVRYIPLYT